MPDPQLYHFKLPKYQGPILPAPPSAGYPGVENHIESVTSSRKLRSDGQIKAFVIHATAGYSSYDAMSVLFSHRASWHWLIPDEDEQEHGKLIWRCIPEDLAAWHVRNDKSHVDVNNGSQYVNYWSLGVEIVNRQQNDKFSDWQLEQTAALVRYAWSKYPNLVDVVSHAKLDPARRTDPGSDFPWDRFREMVLAPASEVPIVAASLIDPVQIVAQNGDAIECDPRFLDGVTVAEVRPLVESLGFKVVYEDGPPRRMLIKKKSNKK